MYFATFTINLRNVVCKSQRTILRTKVHPPEAEHHGIHYYILKHRTLQQQSHLCCMVFSSSQCHISRTTRNLINKNFLKYSGATLWIHTDEQLKVTLVLSQFKGEHKRKMSTSNSLLSCPIFVSLHNMTGHQLGNCNF